MKSFFLAMSFGVLAATAASAQGQMSGPPAQSPFMQACGADVKSFCASAQSREDRRACVQANKDKFSDSCKTFMASHPMHHQDQGQMQGPGQPH